MNSIISGIFSVRFSLILVAFSLPSVLFAQARVESYHHDSTVEGNILRGRADAVIALSQARLINEQAVAQRLENMIRECDVAYKQFSTRNQMQKERREHDFEMLFDSIKFNQQLLEVRRDLEMKGAMEHPGTGDLTNEMNLLLKKFVQKTFDKNATAAMKVELSREQLQAIYLSDGTSTFTGTGGKTKLDNFSWPYILKLKEFNSDRAEFEKLYEQAMKESDENKSPSPEAIVRLLEKKVEMEVLVDNIRLSTKADLRTTEMKWRSEAKNYLRELTQTLNNYSNHDSERLKKYVFSGKTVGDLLDHMLSKGLRFAHPNKQDDNLYASIFFLLRYSYRDFGKNIDETVPNTEDNIPASAPIAYEVVEHSWKNGSPDAKMISTQEGLCFLAGASGRFLGGGEWAKVATAPDGYWHLTGGAFQPLWAKSLSLRFDSTAKFKWKSAEFNWKRGDPPTRMIAKDQGFCFLSTIGGGFRGGGESARILADKDGYWYLTGSAIKPITAFAIAVSITQPKPFLIETVSYRWDSGAARVKMLHKDEGFCFLTGIGGGFGGYGERVEIRLDDDGYWYLEGSAMQPIFAEAMGLRLAKPQRKGDE